MEIMNTMTCTAEDGKVFQPIEDAYFDHDLYSGEEYYVARAISPDDAPEDGDVPVYTLKFAICDFETEDAGQACDWTVVDDYNQIGYMAIETVEMLLHVRRSEVEALAQFNVSRSAAEQKPQRQR